MRSSTPARQRAVDALHRGQRILKQSVVSHLHQLSGRNSSAQLQTPPTTSDGLPPFLRPGAASARLQTTRSARFCFTRTRNNPTFCRICRNKGQKRALGRVYSKVPAQCQLRSTMLLADPMQQGEAAEVQERRCARRAAPARAGSENGHWGTPHLPCWCRSRGEPDRSHLPGDPWGPRTSVDGPRRGHPGRRSSGNQR